jgi:uncharacterized protein DUF4406
VQHLPTSPLRGKRPPTGSKCYIAGPMSQFADQNFNYDAFNACAAELRAMGYGVTNPAENFEGKQDLSWETYLREGIRQVTLVDFVVLLPGWEFSSGANIEVQVAKALRLPLLECGTLEPITTP